MKDTEVFKRNTKGSHIGVIDAMGHLSNCWQTL